MTKNVIFLGNKPIGYRCLKYLYENREEFKINLIGVLTKKDTNISKETESVFRFSKEHNLRIVESLEKLTQIDDIDIMISVQYHKILNKSHINKAKDIAINLHMAPLPEYRGCNQFSYAIINDDDIFGTTIHRLENNIDGGAIICEKRFEIPDNCFVKELYDLTEKKLEKLFKENIKDIIDSDFDLTPQDELIEERGSELHYRKEIEDLKNIDLKWNEEKIERHIRGTSMPGFEPPYTEINGEKIYFVRSEYYEE